MRIRTIMTWPIFIAISLVWVAHKIARLFSRVSTAGGSGRVLADGEHGGDHGKRGRTTSKVLP